MENPFTIMQFGVYVIPEFLVLALTKKHLQIIIEIVTLMTLVLLWKIQMIVVGQIVDYNQVSQVKTVTLTWHAIAIAICSLASYI